MNDRRAAELKAVELVTIGDELLLGFTIDTNGAHLARELAQLGVMVVRRTAVGDDVDLIEQTVREALDRTGAVITTGGLGPTTDDVSREAVARVFGKTLIVDEVHLEWMKERWRKRFNRDMPSSNRRQAMRPDGSRKLDNNHGSAPGIYIEDERGRWVAMLPGVPRELRGMTQDTVLPLVKEKGAGQGLCIQSLTLRTTGIPESQLQDQLKDITLTVANGLLLSLAYLPGVDGVDLRLTARADSEEIAKRGLEHSSAAIRRAIKEGLYAEGERDMAEIFVETCKAKHVTVAVAESCTGGMLGARITSVPGSSDIFLGGVIAYSNAVKLRELAVPQADLDAHGAVSEQVVRAMAVGARKKFGADMALAITGIAGPGGGTPEKPVGLVWICVATPYGVEPRKITSWGNREEIRYRASQAAMELARRQMEHLRA
jgi:nicotinamide-nucleotide amidase